MDEEKERSFLFYRRWFDQMQRLPDAERLQVYDSICGYAFRRIVTEMAYYLESIMDNIRQTIDENAEKREAYVEQRRNAIRARWEKNKKNTDVNASHSGDTNEYGSIRTNTSEYDKVKVKVKDKVKVKVKDKVKEEKEEKQVELVSPSIETSSIDPQRSTRVREEKVPDEEKKAFEEKREAATEKAEFFAKVKLTWNFAVSKAKIPMMSKWTDIRRKAVAARAREHGEAAVLDAIERAAQSDFLNGGNKRGFVASFDWVMRPTNFLKVIEGNYDNRENNQYTTTNNCIQNGTYPQRQNHNGGKDAYGRDIEAYEQRRRDFEAYAAAKLARSNPDEVEELPF